MRPIVRWIVGIVVVGALGVAGWVLSRPRPDVGVDCASRSGGCGRPGGTPLAVRDTSSVEIQLARTACFGTCPVYTVTVRGSGEVTFRGVKFVEDSGSSATTIERSRIAALLAAFEQAHYFDLADSYEPGNSACGAAATDHPAVTTSIRIDGRSKRVAHYTGCADVPIALATLENAIDSIVGTGRWIER